MRLFLWENRWARGEEERWLYRVQCHDFLVEREPGIAVHGIALCRWAFGVAKLDGIMLVDRAQKATVLLTRNCTVYSTGARRRHGERGRASEFPI